ncbi:MAG: VTT domain-containing protein [Patescibacteria group bacterium]
MPNFFDIAYIIGTYGYVGIFIIVFLESGIFFALPGDSLLFSAGLFASLFGLNIVFLIALIFIATFLGGVVGYEIGRYLLTLERFPFIKKIIKKEHIEKAHTFFDKYGLWAIVLSRFIPIVRTFMPIAAGVAKMHYYTFLKYSLISSILWSSSMTLLGYFLGQVFPVIKNYVSLLTVLIVLVSILPIAFEMAKKKGGDGHHGGGHH